MTRAEKKSHNVLTVAVCVVVVGIIGSCSTAPEDETSVGTTSSTAAPNMSPTATISSTQVAPPTQVAPVTAEASADPTVDDVQDAFDAYNDGLRTVVCQMLESGMNGEQVAAEFTKSFADVVASGAQQIESWPVFIADAVDAKCPQLRGLL